MLTKAFQSLKSKLGDKVLKETNLANFTTWRVGGPARIFAYAEDLSDLRRLLEVASSFGLPYFILGKGSNLLVSDDGFQGIVIKLGGIFQKFSFENESLNAGAAASLPALVLASVRKGLKGLTFASGIPGSLGGALCLNASFEGQSIGNRVKKVVVYTENGLKNLDSSGITFEYRQSSLINQGVILEATLRLEAGEQTQLKGELNRYFQKRRMSQPLGFLSAGSVFKNPPGKIAAKLIEETGFKGKKQGKAQVSLKHANFIINLGGAKAQEIFNLIKVIQKQVYSKKGIHLEPEVEFLGEFETRKREV